MSENIQKTDLSQTPVDIREKCRHLCRQLGGVWSNVGINDVDVRPIIGGFSNQLYRCQLSDSVGRVGTDNEPRDVVVRLYGKKTLNNEFAGAGDQRADVIVGSLMAKHGLGPNFYVSFPSGEIQEFVKHKQFRVDEQRDPKLVQELAQKLANFHALNPLELSRDNEWLSKTIDNAMKKADKEFPIDRLIEELKLDTLNTDRLKRELQWLYKCMKQIDSPVCLAHNDLRGNNIMVLDESNTHTSGQRVMFCDFECSGFGYRGTDLGFLFAEWNRDGFNDYKTVQQFPDDIQIKPFIDEYMAESIRLRGQAFSGDPKNTFTHIMREIKVFTLVSNLFIIAILLGMDECTDAPSYTKLNLTTGANYYFKNYLHLKAMFINDNTIDYDSYE